jgi:hypothetical protein
MACVMRCCETIENLIFLASNSSASADDITPVLVYVLLQVYYDRNYLLQIPFSPIHLLYFQTSNISKDFTHHECKEKSLTGGLSLGLLLNFLNSYVTSICHRELKFLKQKLRILSTLWVLIACYFDSYLLPYIIIFDTAHGINQQI